jgi:hypothetical protein
MAGRLVPDPAIQKIRPSTVLPHKLPVISVPNFLRVQPDGVLLFVKLQPRASANEIVTLAGTGDELRIRVTAPPVDDAANEALIQLLADRLDCARRRVELVGGHKSRHKVVKFHGGTPAEVLARFGFASLST